MIQIGELDKRLPYYLRGATAAELDKMGIQMGKLHMQVETVRMDGKDYELEVYYRDDGQVHHYGAVICPGGREIICRDSRHFHDSSAVNKTDDKLCKRVKAAFKEQQKRKDKLP